MEDTEGARSEGKRNKPRFSGLGRCGSHWPAIKTRINKCLRVPSLGSSSAASDFPTSRLISLYISIKGLCIPPEIPSAEQSHKYAL